VDIERAVEILNEKKHRGFTDWWIQRLVGDPTPQWVAPSEMYNHLEIEEAIAIAEKYEGTAADLAAARERVAALEGEREWLLNYGNEWLCDRYCYTRPEHIEAGRQEILAEMAAALAPAP
jgi:hypothetical protein